MNTEIKSKKHTTGIAKTACPRRKLVIGLSILGVFLAIIIAAATIMYPRYHNEMDTARTRLLEGSRIIQTASGPVEYVDIGEGYPVLIAHGNGGGYDQGILLAQEFLGDGFRWIAPSRFGYLRTPIPEDGSAEAQADAYASLLDELNIEQVAVIGISDGGPSTLQFALRHPERVTSIAMISAKSEAPPAETHLQKVIFNTIFRSDFVYWSITTYGRSFLLSMFGVSPEVQAEFTPADHEFVDNFISSMHPMSLRKAGIYNDRRYLSTSDLNEYPLDRITTPTMVIHAVDDSLQPYHHGANTAEKTRGARLIRLESGGHFLAGHMDEVRSELTGFIQQHEGTWAGTETQEETNLLVQSN